MRYINMKLETSSMTSFGDATRIEMPLSSSSLRTSFQSRFRLDLARDSALPAPWHVDPNVFCMPSFVPVST